MKIAILKESLYFGGTERSAVNVSKILDEKHQVFMAVYDASQTKYGYGGTLVDFGLPAKQSVFAKIANNCLRIYRYEKLIRKEKIQLLYEFISINNPISRIRHKNITRIISARDFSVLREFVQRFHKCLQASDGMICNSNYLREFYLSKYPEDKEKVFTVYNIIDREEILRQAKEDVEPEFTAFLEKHPKTVVSVGRFCKGKGFEYLMESVAKARETDENLGLVLVGDGAYLGRYEEHIRRFGLETHIYMTGFQKNPYKYMARGSCYALSSLNEGFPNVLAEAMALGLPVIATNCYSGPAEILRNDGDYEAVSDVYQLCDYGIITPCFEASDRENAVSQMAKAIVDLLGDGNLMKKYSALAAERAACFSAEVAAERLEEIFNLLMK